MEIEVTVNLEAKNFTTEELRLWRDEIEKEIQDRAN